MPTNPLGSGVSRYINDRDRQYASVVFQASKPPLDSELNLISLIDSKNTAGLFCVMLTSFRMYSPIMITTANSDKSSRYKTRDVWVKPFGSTYE